MAIGKYCKYKCDNCGYKKVSFESDITIVLPKQCPRCGEKMKRLDCSINPPFEYIIREFFEKIFTKRDS